MFTRLIAGGLVLCVCIDCGAADGNFYTGNKLKELLDEHSNPNSEKPYLGGVGLGYVLGVHDANATFLCSPEGITAGQAAAVVNKYLLEHPAELHRDADVLVMRAFGAVWPCAKRDPAPPARPTPTPKPAPSTKPANPF